MAKKREVDIDEMFRLGTPIDEAFAILAQERIGALIVAAEPLFTAERPSVPPHRRSRIKRGKE